MPEKKLNHYNTTYDMPDNSTNVE